MNDIDDFFRCTEVSQFMPHLRGAPIVLQRIVSIHSIYIQIFFAGFHNTFIPVYVLLNPEMNLLN